MSLPAKSTGCRRRHPRRVVPRDDRHVLLFNYPTARGRTYMMPLNDVSPSGLSFLLTEPLPGLEMCAPIRRVDVQIGDERMQADLIVIHITTKPDGSTVCGTLCYPETDDDLRTLKRVIAAIETN